VLGIGSAAHRVGIKSAACSVFGGVFGVRRRVRCSAACSVFGIALGIEPASPSASHRHRTGIALGIAPALQTMQ
jgi:hypothetical protein